MRSLVHSLVTATLVPWVTALPQVLPGAGKVPPSSLQSCFYNYGCPTQCIASPNLEWCEQSIDAVCSSVSNSTANGQTTWFSYDTGEVGQQTLPLPIVISNVESQANHCLAIVIVSDLVKQFPDFDTCKGAFQAINGCAVETTAGYNAACVGGSINIEGCDVEGKVSDAKLAQDPTLPAYVLGSPAELAFASEPHPPWVRARRANEAAVLSIPPNANNLTMGPYAPL